jgi:hypothetical protein
MLRVEIQKSADTWYILLEGRFTGDDAEHARMLTTRCLVGVKVVVDLTEVAFIDNAGEEALSFLGRFGVAFVAPNSYTLDVCERLNLSVARNGISQENALGSAHPNEPRKRSRQFGSDECCQRPLHVIPHHLCRRHTLHSRSPCEGSAARIRSVECHRAHAGLVIPISCAARTLACPLH